MSQRKIIRKRFALLATVITLACIAATVFFVINVRVDHGIRALPFNLVSSKSIDARLTVAQTLFQLALLMIGALWGLIIAKKGEVQIVFEEPAEVFMFFSASIVLLLSICSYGFYLNKISHQFADAARALGNSELELPLSVPDIFDQNVNYLFVLQIVTLVAGIFNGVLTLVSAHKLKGEENENETLAS